MNNPLKDIDSILELGKTLGNLKYSGKVEQKISEEPNHVVREADSQFYNCIKTTKDYIDKEGNLLCRITNFRDDSKNYSEYYIMIYSDEHNYRYL